MGHGVLMMQKQYDIRLADNKIRGCEQNMKSLKFASLTSYEHWDTRLTKLYFNQTEVLMGVGTIGLWGF